ncbi:MAG: integrase [Anaerolineae bacterium]
MTTDDKMKIDERYQYLRRIQGRYRRASRKEKQQLLDEMELHTGLHRKSLIRRLGQTIRRQPRSREREATYGPEVDAVLLLLWESFDYICPERFTSELVTMAERLARHGELDLSPRLKHQLSTISVSTVRRHLPPNPLVHRRRPAPPTPNRHQQAIPAYRIPRDIAEAGHLEMDLVLHCGDSTAGEYLSTLQLIDVATGWSARRAILGRSHLVLADAFLVLFARVPFVICELHPDNGSEFLNENVLTFLHEVYPQIRCSRSRPGCPNDNRLVEQKNHTLVRHFLGDRRFDTVTQARYLNTLYAQLDDFYNFFQPVMKQIDKYWVPATEGRAAYLKRVHDTPRTPLDRWVQIYEDQEQLPEAVQGCLARRETLNPLRLRRDIYHGLDHLFAYPNAESGEVQDVFQTLAHPEAFPAAQAALQDADPVSDPAAASATVSTAPPRSSD